MSILKLFLQEISLTSLAKPLAMKCILTLIMLFCALNSFSQCEDCSSFKEAIKKPEMVKSLIMNGSIAGNRLDSIPASFALFTNLEILYLTDQPIKTIIPEMASLKKLKELSFGGCKLTSIPDFIFELKNLKELILFDNPFTDEYKNALKDRVKKEMPKTTLMVD